LMTARWFCGAATRRVPFRSFYLSGPMPFVSGQAPALNWGNLVLVAMADRMKPPAEFTAKGAIRFHLQVEI